MPTFQQVFDWLVGLPAVALYGAAFGAAVIENLFPPFPSDLVIAVTAFVAANSAALVSVAYVTVVIGNVAGAGLTYTIGRRYGAAGLRARLEARGLLQREAKLESMYIRYGLVGLFFAQLIPGVRGIVPMLAGAFEIDALRALAVVAAAAAIWYGVLMALVYRVGANWDAYAQNLVALGRIGGVGGAVVVAALALAAWWYWRRKRLRQ